MSVVGITLVIFVSSSLCLFLLYFVRFLYQIWWTPICVQRMMRSQGINGPSYSFPHGNNKEIIEMRKEIIDRPMALSHCIFPRILPHIHSWLELYGKNFVSWRGPRAEFIVTELEFVKEILNNKDKAYRKVDAEGYIKKLLGDGLVTTSGKKWAKQRKLANHTFHAENLKNMTPAMVASVEMMLERWKGHEGKAIEVFEEFRLLTSEVISRTAFGSSYLEGKDIFEMLIHLGSLSSRNTYKLPGLWGLLKSDRDIGSEKLEERIRDSITGIMEKRERNREEESLETDFLGLLVKSKNDTDENNRITVDDLVDECKTFYVAGHETTTTLLAWTVLLLGIHTDWQEKARQEVLNLFGHQHPNSDGIARLKTMNMIINETLRLYPPVIALIRKVGDDETRLGKLRLPANQHIMIPTLALHHDAQIWGEDVHLFKPERFSQGVARATKNNPAVYLPFGLGPRGCVGLNFATNEAKIALSMMLQRYSFTLSPTYIHAPVQVLTVRPQHGVQIVLEH